MIRSLVFLLVSPLAMVAGNSLETLENMALQQVSDSCQMDVELLCRSFSMSRLFFPANKNRDLETSSSLAHQWPFSSLELEQQGNEEQSFAIIVTSDATAPSLLLMMSFMDAVMADLSQSPDFYEPKNSCQQEPHRRLQETTPLAFGLPPSDVQCLNDQLPYVSNACVAAVSHLADVRSYLQEKETAKKYHEATSRVVFWMTVTTLMGILLLCCRGVDDDGDEEDDSNVEDDDMYAYRSLEDAENDEEVREATIIYEGIPIQVV